MDEGNAEGKGDEMDGKINKETENSREVHRRKM